MTNFINYYCDIMSCAFGEFLSDEEIGNLSLSGQEYQDVCDYVVVKNIMAGVGEVNLKTKSFGYAQKSLEKYGIKGKVIVDCEEINSLPATALVGDNLIIEISSLDKEDNILNQTADFVGRIDGEVLVKIGQDLEEVGIIVNRFNSSPVETLESFGFLDRKCNVYGLNFIDKDDKKLLKEHDVFCIFSPRSDAYEGRGSVNLYTFVYDDLRFGFSSGKCYNIDMLAEARLAKFNTANLMYEAGLIDNQTLKKSLTNGEFDIKLDGLEKEENIFDKKVEFDHNDYLVLREKIKGIVRKIKENNYV